MAFVPGFVRLQPDDKATMAIEKTPNDDGIAGNNRHLGKAMGSEPKWLQATHRDGEVLPEVVTP